MSLNKPHGKSSEDVPEKVPSLPRRATNFAKAVVKHVATGMRYTTPEQVTERLEICSKCAYQDNGRCKHRNCGCLLAAKARWISEKCPKGYWPKMSF